ncbi:MAG: hypothetical protein AAGH41_02080 [Pseudomonadota bacterium]
MHILVLLVSAIIATSVWWWRFKMVKEATDNVIDAADRFRGARRRQNRASASDLSPITAISDPVTAAATLIRMVVGPDAWPMAHGRLKLRFAELANETLASEAMTYAEWAAGQELDHDRALKLLTERLRNDLTLDERQDLVAMLDDAAQGGDQDIQAQASRAAIALVN